MTTGTALDSACGLYLNDPTSWTDPRKNSRGEALAGGAWGCLARSAGRWDRRRGARVDGVDLHDVDLDLVDLHYTQLDRARLTGWLASSAGQHTQGDSAGHSAGRYRGHRTGQQAPGPAFGCLAGALLLALPVTQGDQGQAGGGVEPLHQLELTQRTGLTGARKALVRPGPRAVGRQTNPALGRGHRPRPLLRCSPGRAAV